MKIYIKHMVSNRCKIVVREELLKLGIRSTSVELGEADVEDVISTEQYEQLRSALLHYGLELIEDSKSILIQKIKSIIIDMVHGTNDKMSVKFSVFLSEKLKYNYTYLSNLFSSVQGICIEKFIILQRIERVKELLTYNELSLSEIAGMMDYNSAAYLSAQFKKVTGYTATVFRQRSDNRRIPREEVGMTG